MQYNVEGIQKISYKNKNNQQVEGTKYHCNYEDRNVSGFAVDEIYVSNKRDDIPLIQIGDVIEVYYNKYGGIDKITLA